jgi:hypothetical protein
MWWVREREGREALQPTAWRHARACVRRAGSAAAGAGGCGAALHPASSARPWAIDDTGRPLCGLWACTAGGHGSGADGASAFLEATLAALAAPQELAAAAAPRMPAHTLRILAQVASHDPLLLMALGTTKEARARAARPAPASCTAGPGAQCAAPSGRSGAPRHVQPVLVAAPSFALSPRSWPWNSECLCQSPTRTS